MKGVGHKKAEISSPCSPTAMETSSHIYLSNKPYEKLQNFLMTWDNMANAQDQVGSWRSVHLFNIYNNAL